MVKFTALRTGDSVEVSEVLPQPDARAVLPTKDSELSDKGIILTLSENIYFISNNVNRSFFN